MQCYYFIGCLFRWLAIFCCLTYWLAFALRSSLYGAVNRMRILFLLISDRRPPCSSSRLHPNKQSEAAKMLTEYVM